MDVLGHGEEEVLCTNTPMQIPVTEDIRESLLAIAARLVSIGKKSAWAVFVKHHRLMEHLNLLEKASQMTRFFPVRNPLCTIFAIQSL